MNLPAVEGKQGAEGDVNPAKKTGGKPVRGVMLTVTIIHSKKREKNS